MNYLEQTEAFAVELDDLIARFEKEYDLPFATVIGVMQMKLHLLCRAAADDEEDGRPVVET